MARPQENHITQAAGNQLHAAQYEGTQQNVAELAVGLHQASQILAVNLDDLSGFGHAGAHHAIAA